ncbi:MAG: type II toxin-antitoxin system Phd/YefM family antitoxin [Gammaproteobacteria bacterium]|nr:type II toxin-antitoxin system Phd/YefM family antitoxin [Gammaproteobacteria bacterium]
MQSISANEAKTHFGDLLLKAQHNPIEISRNGKAVVVILSINEYQYFEDLKMQNLKNRVQQAKKELAAGRLIDGESFFDELLSGKFDE